MVTGLPGLRDLQEKGSLGSKAWMEARQRGDRERQQELPRSLSKRPLTLSPKAPLLEDDEDEEDERNRRKDLMKTSLNPF